MACDNSNTITSCMVRKCFTIALIAVICLTAAVAAVVHDGRWVLFINPNLLMEHGLHYLAPVQGLGEYPTGHDAGSFNSPLTLGVPRSGCQASPAAAAQLPVTAVAR